jgi:hypothetical protein
MNHRHIISAIYEIDTEAKITASDAANKQRNSLDAAREYLGVQ